MDWSSFLLDALPHAVGTPVCTATLRASPDDFQVDEIPSFEPSGDYAADLAAIQARVGPAMAKHPARYGQ